MLRADTDIITEGIMLLCCSTTISTACRRHMRCLHSYALSPLAKGSAQCPDIVRAALDVTIGVVDAPLYYLD